jgi:hypothetical protein
MFARAPPPKAAPIAVSAWNPRTVASFQVAATPNGGAYIIARAGDGTLWQYYWADKEWRSFPALPDVDAPARPFA